MLQEARHKAQDIHDLVVSTNLVISIDGRNYVRADGWAVVARLMNEAVGVEWSRPLEDGWEAHAQILNADGIVVGGGDGMCTTDERGWGNKSDHSLRSMAQTRACVRAMRQRYGWIMRMAGYASAPAEEMEEPEPPGVGEGAAPAPPGESRAADPAELRRAEVNRRLESLGITDPGEAHRIMAAEGAANWRILGDETVWKRVDAMLTRRERELREVEGAAREGEAGGN